MKHQRLFLLAAIASAALTVGCATTGSASTAGPNAMRGPADAVIRVNGLS